MYTRRGVIETVNDRDGLLVNFWRAVRSDPEQTAYHASWPVSHVDLVARRMVLKEWLTNDANLERMMVDDQYCDHRIAGYWVWCQALAIGSLSKQLAGPWWRAGGNLVKLRSPQGVEITRPHVTAQQGIEVLSLRHNPLTRPYSFVNPNVIKWFTFLQARLRHVRILCDDWKRVVAMIDTNYYQRETPIISVFLDPPYTHTLRVDNKYYTIDDAETCRDVLNWCKTYGSDQRYRIVLAAYEDDGHDELLTLGWRKYRWYRRNRDMVGLAKSERAKQLRELERLYASPHCCAPISSA